MISRRSFVTLGAGLTASLFATGHSRLRPTVSSRDSAALIGPDLPVRLPANLPVDLAADPAIDSLANKVALSVPRGSYSPPIAGLHPDNMILEQVALAPQEPSAAARCDPRSRHSAAPSMVRSPVCGACRTMSATATSISSAGISRSSWRAT